MIDRKEELQELLKNEKKFLNEITNKYKDLSKNGIPEIFKIEVSKIFNSSLYLIYEVLNNMDQKDPLFKLLYLHHEKTFLFMKKNNLNCPIKYDEDEFLKNIEYPLKNLKF